MFFYSSRAHCAASAISRTSGREVAAATSQRHAELSSAINHGKLPLHGEQVLLRLTGPDPLMMRQNHRQCLILNLRE